MHFTEKPTLRTGSIDGINIGYPVVSFLPVGELLNSGIGLTGIILLGVGCGVWSGSLLESIIFRSKQSCPDVVIYGILCYRILKSEGYGVPYTWLL